MISESKEITKVPDESNMNIFSRKEKDPKKVAAGKKLAIHNKKAREYLAREMKREKVKADNQIEKCLRVSYVNDKSFGTALPLVVIGVIAARLYLSYRNTHSTILQPQQLKYLD